MSNNEFKENHEDFWLLSNAFISIRLATYIKHSG